MPFGRVQLSVTAPTGSASSRTTSMPSAIAATRFSSSASRSRKADGCAGGFGLGEVLGIGGQDRALRCARIAFAMAASALSFCPAGASASVRAAPPRALADIVHHGWRKWPCFRWF